MCTGSWQAFTLHDPLRNLIPIFACGKWFLNRKLTWLHANHIAKNKYFFVLVTRCDEHDEAHGSCLKSFDVVKVLNWKFSAMNGDLVEEGKAKAAGIISVLVGISAFIQLICGFIYLSKGGPEGSGLWSGIGVNNSSYIMLRVDFKDISQIVTLADYFWTAFLSTKPIQKTIGVNLAASGPFNQPVR